MAKRKNAFHVQVSKTSPYNIRMTFRAKDPQDRGRHYRELAVLVYKVAAELERRSQKLAAGWVVSPEVFNGRIDLELTDRDDERQAKALVEKVLGDLGGELRIGRIVSYGRRRGGATGTGGRGGSVTGGSVGTGRGSASGGVAGGKIHRRRGRDRAAKRASFRTSGLSSQYRMVISIVARPSIACTAFDRRPA